MAHPRAAPAVPAHLRRFVVEQDYDQYTEIDHAVWRFVLLQTYSQLRHTAHAAYSTGLAATGIGVERIPRIDEMNELLSRFGWGAVCVDGFVPPRAFVAFQANRLLPIAAEIRTAEHLAYTPAPDIIHEAAGHAPILSEPSYASFIQEIGAVSEQAFANPSDREIYRVIHDLSEVKEDPSATPEQVSRAEEALERILSEDHEISESARLARLYWWTAEYGLVGTPQDYRLYGAGLLSSLGESRSCHEPSVRKLPLSASCVEFDYDITRAQPQLFVARDFEHLHEVLEQVSESLAYRVGGARALEAARESEETATVVLDSGLEVAGVVSTIHRHAGGVSLVQLRGETVLFDRGMPLEGVRCPNEYVVPLGSLKSGRRLSEISEDDLTGGRGYGFEMRLELDSGVCMAGILRGTRARDGRILCALVERFELSLPGGRVFRAQSLYPLCLGSCVPSVRASAPAAYHPSTTPSLVRVPRPRFFSARERRLLSLYEKAVEAFHTRGEREAVGDFERIATELQRQYPDEWLLRWNLLESLVKVGGVRGGDALVSRLTGELEALESRYQRVAPIATGLSYLQSVARSKGAEAHSE